MTELGYFVQRGVARLVAPDLTQLEFAILRSFLKRDEWIAVEMAKEGSTHKSRISREVAKLADKGLIRRRRLRSDRRVVRLALTEEGRALAAEIRERIPACEARLSEGVSKEEMDIFVSVSSRVMANYEALAGSPI